ncbi:MAG: DUF424 family protein [Methanofollis sp.]|uniref:DUF424 domain-containing protein n=1 Tax=Methanofollis sp. TaxID=2052835 RepID=UPI002625D331|nr:DUF424 family protein [Methanofollis sp.]MDD4254206.1 DUF424 family protein [Methanofollis sp.]
MYLKIHRTPSSEVVAVCDDDLLNTTLREGDLCIQINGDFYGTTHATEEEVRAALRHAANANVIGKESVGIAVTMGLISENTCRTICGVPHAFIIAV